MIKHMKQLKIQIIGVTSTGKSTIANEIYFHLKQLGYECSITDEYEEHKIPSMEQHNAVADKTKINIETFNANHEYL